MTETAHKSESLQPFGLDRFAHIALLYDFYAAMLTKKQSEIIEMYFMQNLSLSEIAEISGITRQAASILLNRSEKLLIKYENRLRQVETYLEEQKKHEAVQRILNSIITLPDVSDSVKDKLKKAIEYFD